MMHRDLKADNVLVTLVNGKPVAKLTDFGLVRDTTDTKEVNTDCGTEFWKAPEVGDHRVNHGLYTEKADTFSFGVLMFYMLTLKMPWGDRTNYANCEVSKPVTLSAADYLSKFCKECLS